MSSDIDTVYLNADNCAAMCCCIHLLVSLYTVVRDSFMQEFILIFTNSVTLMLSYSDASEDEGGSEV